MSLAGAGQPPREPARKSYGWGADAMVLLTDATAARTRRLVAAARAVARVRRHGVDVRLAVLAPANTRAIVRALTAAFGGRSVQFFDRKRDMARLRAAADVFLQATEADNGAAALAAMAAGLPVLLPRSDGAADLVTDGVQGWILAKPNDAGELAWRLRNLAEPGLRGAMAAQARALAEHRRTRSYGS